MSFTIAAFKFHKIYQYIIPTTYTVEIDGLSITPGKKFTQSRNGNFNKSILLNLFSALIYYAGRLLWLTKFEFNSTPLFELMSCALVAAFYVAAVSLWYTEVNYCTEFCMIARQSFFVQYLHPRYSKILFEQLSVREAFVYSFALTGFMSSIAVMLSPLVLYFIPPQALFGRSIPTILLSFILFTWVATLSVLRLFLF